MLNAPNVTVFNRGCSCLLLRSTDSVLTEFPANSVEHTGRVYHRLASNGGVTKLLKQRLKRTTLFFLGFDPNGAWSYIDVKGRRNVKLRPWNPRTTESGSGVANGT